MDQWVTYLNFYNKFFNLVIPMIWREEINLISNSFLFISVDKTPISSCIPLLHITRNFVVLFHTRLVYFTISYLSIHVSYPLTIMPSSTIPRDKIAALSSGVARSFEIMQPALSEHTSTTLRTIANNAQGDAITYQYEYGTNSLTVLIRTASIGNSKAISITHGDSALDFRELMEGFDRAAQFNGKSVIHALIMRMFNEHSKTCIMRYTYFQNTDFVITIWDPKQRSRMDITVAIAY